MTGSVLTYLPKFGTDLVAALTGLDVNNFSHGAVGWIVGWLVVSTEDFSEHKTRKLET